MLGLRDGYFRERYLHCSRCGAPIWEGMDYQRDGYGGYICGKCKDEEDEDEIPGDDKAR